MQLVYSDQTHTTKTGSLFFSYLHSHVWCSTKDISTYSWPCSPGLIFNNWELRQIVEHVAGGKVKKDIYVLSWHANMHWWSHNTAAILRRDGPYYLHGDIRGLSRMALQILIATATSAAHQGHTWGAVDVLHLPRVLLDHLHQLLYSPAETTAPHILEH